MTDPLAALTQAGVSIWLDDLSRDRLTSGSLADLVARDHVAGVTTNPTIFARAIAERGAYEAQLRDLAARGVGVGRGASGADHLRRALGVRCPPPGLRRDRRRGRAGVDRGRPAARARHRGHHRRGAGTVVGGGPAQPVHQDPGGPAGPAGDRRLPGRGDQHQRHADLLAGSLRPGHGCVPRRDGTGQERRPRPVRDRVRGLVLRIPGGH